MAKRHGECAGEDEEKMYGPDGEELPFDPELTPEERMRLLAFNRRLRGTWLKIERGFPSDMKKLKLGKFPLDVRRAFMHGEDIEFGQDGELHSAELEGDDVDF